MKRMMWTMGLTLVLFSTNSIAANVIRAGKEWLQPADFTNLSWNDAVAVCPEPDFLCDGELNGIDVTGYTFASIEQITDLFNSYGIDPPLGSAPDVVIEVDSTWAPALFDEFGATTTSDVRLMECIGSTTFATGDSRVFARTGFVAEVLDDHVAATDGTASIDRGQERLGVCLCRDPTSVAPQTVPTMSTYMLIFTMLGLLGIAGGGLFRRRKALGR